MTSVTTLANHRDHLHDVRDLREVVDVVIGVDTHVHTHAAAVIDARTGGVLAEVSVEATAAGYAQLLEFADAHAALRAWAIEGTGSHGAGLTRHLQRHNEVVIELDRPVRAKRRHGAKSDPLDAIRAAREALARPRLGAPRAGGDRQALAVLLTVRRSAVEAAGDAQRQLLSLLIAAPEPLGAKFHGLSTTRVVEAAAILRARSSHDTETATTIAVLRALARRVQTLNVEAAAHEHAIAAIVKTWRPDLATRPARPDRGQPHRGRDRACRVVPSRTHLLRSSVRDDRRRRSDPRHQRTDHRPSPAQPIRRLPTQPRLAHHRAHPHPPRPRHPRLHRPPHRRRQNPTRDQTLPQTLRRLTPLPSTRTPTHNA
ncbi:transposase [Nocardioides sp. IC4_145]|uniref:IS110 family transposase n=1 Tax=Nocardioides sp. IC4_145 TaxID=2714037 RepID=UPI001A97F76D|nr:transposase [Nocardioides sp. IC4_145]